MTITRTFDSTLDRMLTLNRALDQAFNGAWNGETSRVWVPALDVIEKHDAYLVQVELPGVEQSQIDISFEQNVLTLRGTKRSPVDTGKDGEVRVYAAERVSGAFERSIRLPEFVDAETISAELQNGVLTITIPKAPAAQPRKIEIRSGASAKELSA